MPSPTSPSAIPERLGRYEVQAELGRGSMGVVYLARDPLIGRLVALKVFRPNLGADGTDVDRFRSRFLREAQSAGILSHPNIVTVHDVVDEGEHSGGPVFIAMEYVQGTNLKEVLRYGKSLELSQVLDIVRQVAAALDYAHSRGVVHRDVKPANVMLTPERQVKITDFGIAQFDTTSLTHDGQLLGTPNYMSPEQVQGREVDLKTDLFSLGVVLYEMITRHKPFAGENLAAVSHRIVYEMYTPPEEYTGGLPPGVSEIFPRALAKDRADRYPSAQALADDLSRAVEVYSRDVALSDTQDLPAKRPSPPDDDEHDTLPGVPLPAAPVAAAAAGGSTRGAARGVAGRLGPALAATGAALARIGPAGRPTGRRLAIVASVTVALAFAIGVSLLLFAVPREGGGDPAAFGPEHRLEVEYLSLMREGRRATSADDPVAAAVAYRRAESLLPDRPAARRLRIESERSAGELQADTFRRRQLDLQTAAAAAALAGRRYQEALATASVVLEVEPDNEEAARLVRQARSGLARENAQRDDTLAEAAAEEAEEERLAEGAPPSAAAPAAVVPESAYLDVQLVAEGEGRLMLRVGDDLIANNPYDFFEREGIFRRKRPLRGMHEVRRVRLAPGTHDVRFWVTPAGLAARSDKVRIELAPGASRTLRLYLSPEKQLTWAVE